MMLPTEAPTTSPTSCPDYLRARQSRIRQGLADQGLDAFVTLHAPNLRYFSLFTGGTGLGVLTPEGFWLLIDPRYTTQARQETRGVEVRESLIALEESCSQLLGKLHLHRVGYEARRTTVESLSRLRRAAPSRTEWVNADGFVDTFRTIKDSQELAILRRGAKLTWEFCDDIIRLLVPGVSEKEVAAELEYQLIRKGATKTSFDTIVASGRRSALPHGTATENKLPKNGFVVVDFGIVLDGYCSDMTRTFYLGDPGTKERRAYLAVQAALEEAEGCVRPGIPAGEVDRKAREVLRRHKLEKRFTHSLGHGVGLEVHESPVLRRNQQAPLREGMVITVEPGVYVPGWGGIRIEDMVAVGASGGEILTPYTHELRCL